MKRLAAVGVTMLTLGISLGVSGALAAGKYDGSLPLLCAPITILECGDDGACQRSTAEEVNIPQFVRVNVAAMTLSGADESGRTAPIKHLERLTGRIVIQGAQGERGWTVTIAEDTGKMSAVVAGAQEAFVIFGACTPL
jgi:hypothetical protein